MQINPYESSRADIPEATSNRGRWIVLGLLGLFLVGMITPLTKPALRSGTYQSTRSTSQQEVAEPSHRCDYSTKEEPVELVATE